MCGGAKMSKKSESLKRHLESVENILKNLDTSSPKRAWFERERVRTARTIDKLILEGK